VRPREDRHEAGTGRCAQSSGALERRSSPWSSGPSAAVRFGRPFRSGWFCRPLLGALLESPFPRPQVAIRFGVLEVLPGIAMLAARTPVASTPRRRLRRAAAFFSRTPCLVLRLPQLPAREVFHLRVRLTLLDAVERWQQVFPLGCAKRCR